MNATTLFRHAAGTIGARSTPGGDRCSHCDGTGLARLLWEPAAVRRPVEDEVA
ncbi:hypothetical protein [Streptomyces sp. NPDC093795]|uniref:hypothetical protein n=1 Tax=Streptomyces sp. NPDC093795 TaxID=3366051 RepID=UPI0038114486